MTTDQTIAIPAADQAVTGSGPQPVQRASLFSRVTADVSYAGQVMTRLLPLMERIAMSGSLDRLFEAALDAEKAGVAAAVFQAAEDSLRVAAARKAQETVPPAGTGPGPVVAAAVEVPGTATFTPHVVVPDAGPHRLVTPSRT